MKVWITSQALTKGIYEADGHFGRGGLWAIRYGTGLYDQYVRKEHVHETLESAQAHARSMRDARMKGLETQMDTLRKLRFGD